jgi:hypothetical protein
VADSFMGTAAAILDGQNASTGTDISLRKMVKTVNTGWTAMDATDDGAASHTLSLWGTADNLALWDEKLTGLLPAAVRTKQGDTFVLAMSYDRRQQPEHLGNGGFGIATRDARGAWVNAVDGNAGGTKTFVVGSYDPSMKLGTYGVDPSTKTAWAIVNFDGDFAVRRGIESVPGKR